MRRKGAQRVEKGSTNFRKIDHRMMKRYAMMCGRFIFFIFRIVDWIVITLNIRYLLAIDVEVWIVLMTDHQNSIRIVSEEIDVRLLVKMSRLAVSRSCQASVMHPQG